MKDKWMMIDEWMRLNGLRRSFVRSWAFIKCHYNLICILKSTNDLSFHTNELQSSVYNRTLWMNRYAKLVQLNPGDDELRYFYLRLRKGHSLNRLFRQVRKISSYFT